MKKGIATNPVNIGITAISPLSWTIQSPKQNDKRQDCLLFRLANSENTLSAFVND